MDDDALDRLEALCAASAGLVERQMCHHVILDEHVLAVYNAVARVLLAPAALPPERAHEVVRDALRACLAAQAPDAPEN